MLYSILFVFLRYALGLSIDPIYTLDLIRRIYKHLRRPNLFLCRVSSRQHSGRVPKNKISSHMNIRRGAVIFRGLSNNCRFLCRYYKNCNSPCPCCIAKKSTASFRGRCSRCRFDNRRLTSIGRFRDTESIAPCRRRRRYDRR